MDYKQPQKPLIPHEKPPVSQSKPVVPPHKHAADEETASVIKKKTFIAFLVGLIIGFGSFWLWDRGDTDARSEKIADDSSLEEDILSGDISPDAMVDKKGDALKNRFLVSNQTAGSAVTIKQIVLAENAWIAIHESIEGIPGRILGAARFDAGIYPLATVDLLREMEAGNHYFAALRKDDGITGFDINGDIPLTTESGDMVMTSFSTLTPSPSGR